MLRFALFAAVLSGVLAGQEEPVATFKTSVSLVKVDAKVSGRDGRSINDLTKDDLVVFDEDSRRDIVEFDRESETQPLRLVLLPVRRWSFGILPSVGYRLLVEADQSPPQVRPLVGIRLLVKLLLQFLRKHRIEPACVGLRLVVHDILSLLPIYVAT